MVWPDRLKLNGNSVRGAKFKLITDISWFIHCSEVSIGKKKYELKSQWMIIIHNFIKCTCIESFSFIRHYRLYNELYKQHNNYVVIQGQWINKQNENEQVYYVLFSFFNNCCTSSCTSFKLNSIIQIREFALSTTTCKSIANCYINAVQRYRKIYVNINR